MPEFNVLKITYFLILNRSNLKFWINCASAWFCELVIRSWMFQKLPWRGAWVARLVKHKTLGFLAQVVISRFMRWSPASGFVLTARSLLAIVSLPLSLPHPTLSLKKKNKKKKKKKQGKNWKKLKQIPQWFNTWPNNITSPWCSLHRLQLLFLCSEGLRF